MAGSWISRRTLFQKYFVALFGIVVMLLLAKGISDAWFGYRDQRAMLNALLRLEAESAASKIGAFLDDVSSQLGWTIQEPWTPGSEEQHRLDALGLLRQVPAVIGISLIDDAGAERLYMSRIELDRTASGADRSGDPAVIGARSRHTWYGPVSYSNGSEPFMKVAIAGNRKAAGVAIADINLKFIWDVVSAIRVGHSGYAFVVDQPGRVIAHPDITIVLRGTDSQTSLMLLRLRDEIAAARGEAIATETAKGEALVAMAAIPGADWTVFVEQPLSEAFAPIFLALWRTGWLLLAGAAVAALLAYWLARRMTGPIRLLEQGAERIGSGQFDYRIEVSTGDELERLANRFNRMAGEVALSQQRSERIERLKRFLAPQVAELVEQAGDESILSGQEAEIVVAFCDLRGFTAFSAHAAPKEIIEVLGAYYEVLGAVITKYEATLTNFSGDGLMVLLNAPIPCPEPVLRGVEMALDMQDAVQSLIVEWLKHGYTVGFGVGLATGPATVGRIGYASRAEYTAIGNVVNLASRLCALANNRQILVDAAIAGSIGDRFDVIALGMHAIKGYDEKLPIYELSGGIKRVPTVDALGGSDAPEESS